MEEMCNSNIVSFPPPTVHIFPMRNSSTPFEFMTFQFGLLYLDVGNHFWHHHPVPGIFPCINSREDKGLGATLVTVISIVCWCWQCSSLSTGRRNVSTRWSYFSQTKQIMFYRTAVICVTHVYISTCRSGIFSETVLSVFHEMLMFGVSNCW